MESPLSRGGHSRPVAFALLLVPIFAACKMGNATEDLATIDQRDISGIAQPGDPSKLAPVEYADRSFYGSANTASDLAYPNLTPTEAALLDADNPDSPLHFFITLHTDEEGVGPLFNQRRCLGCHFSSQDIVDNAVLSTPPASLNIVNTPVSRAGRQGVTNYNLIGPPLHNNVRPNTAAFTLFGDFSPASGTFDPLTILGGFLQHVEVVYPSIGCESTPLPPQSIDPDLMGGTDPITGVSELGFRREHGERAAPPYIGRGLIEAIYAGDILANEDPLDLQGSNSSLPPQPDPTICPGDCISGRHNENSAALSMVGGDPVIRLSRFGLRGAGPTLLQFVVGGTQGEIGLTSPFSPTEQNNIENVGFTCDKVPDPELKVGIIFDLRSMIRLFAPPRHAPQLLATTVEDSLTADVQAGAQLFGVDLAAFQSRVIPGMTPTNFGDVDADRGIAKDRQLNCVGCHIPIMKTGESPAAIGGAHLSNRWAPIFSDLLIHRMTSYPAGPATQLVPTPPPGINRNLADFVVPAAVTGLAGGEEWRTPPLMGLGKVGPPFMHDARVFLNVTGKHIPNPDPVHFPNDGQADPNDPAPMTETVYSAQGVLNAPLPVDTLDHALQAAIELHDLPPPPDHNGDGVSSYANCPTVEPANCGEGPSFVECYPVTLANDICGRGSSYRSEARNTIEKWHALTVEQQQQVIKFLESL
jgi:CxxC motif-containing protein (DUF1111 family)